MAAQFDEGGIRFRYPENWRLEREDTDARGHVCARRLQASMILLRMA